MAAEIARFVRGLGSSEFAKASQWAEGDAALAELGPVGIVIAGFEAKDMLKDAIRARARGVPKFQPLPGLAGAADAGAFGAGVGPVSLDPIEIEIPEGKEPDPDAGLRRRKPTTGPRRFTTQPVDPPDFSLPLSDVEIGRVAPGSRPVPVVPTPSVGERVSAGIVGAAGAAGAAAGRAARGAVDVAAQARSAANRLRNSRNAAIVGAGATTALIGSVIAAGGEVTSIYGDGTAEIKFPGRDPQIVPIPGIASGTPTGSALGFGGARLGGAQLGGPSAQVRGKYRTPRHGRWNMVEFNRFARAAAGATGASPSPISGRDAALAAATHPSASVVHTPTGPRQIGVHRGRG